MSILLRFAILATFISASCIAADSSESRFESSKFDRSKARKLTAEEAKLFGPGAGKYRYDATMIRAAEIAARRARKH